MGLLRMLDHVAGGAIEMCKEFIDRRERTRDAAGFDVGQPLMQPTTEFQLEGLFSDHYGCWR